jgi:hypothetical protein
MHHSGTGGRTQGQKPKAKTERIEPAPHDLPSVLMWCDGSTTPICSGFTISQMFLMPLGSRASVKKHTE